MRLLSMRAREFLDFYFFGIALPALALENLALSSYKLFLDRAYGYARAYLTRKTGHRSIDTLLWKLHYFSDAKERILAGGSMDKRAATEASRFRERGSEGFTERPLRSVRRAWKR